MVVKYNANIHRVEFPHRQHNEKKKRKNSKKQQVSIFVCNIKTVQRTSWSFILVYAGGYTQTKEIKIRENVTLN